MRAAWLAAKRSRMGVDGSVRAAVDEANARIKLTMMAVCLIGAVAVALWNRRWSAYGGGWSSSGAVVVAVAVCSRSLSVLAMLNGPSGSSSSDSAPAGMYGSSRLPMRSSSSQLVKCSSSRMRGDCGSLAASASERSSCSEGAAVAAVGAAAGRCRATGAVVPGVGPARCLDVEGCRGGGIVQPSWTARQAEGR